MTFATGVVSLAALSYTELDSYRYAYFLPALAAAKDPGV